MQLNIAGITPPYDGPRKRSVAYSRLVQVAHAGGAYRDGIHLAARNYGCEKVLWPLGQPDRDACLSADPKLTVTSATCHVVRRARFISTNENAHYFWIRVGGNIYSRKEKPNRRSTSSIAMF
jgi:hypothetical protein